MEKDIIEDFLLNYSSKSTIRTYRFYIHDFFKRIDADPQTYFTDKRDYETDVKTYWRSINTQAPKSIYTGLAAVRMFLSENNIELPIKVWRNIRRRTQGNRSVTDDKVPTQKEFKEILTHGDTKSRAFFLTLASSGMRIGELCSIKLNDIDLHTTPAEITIRAEYTKTGNKRMCFISKEASDNIKAWLTHRETYLKAAVNRAKFLNEYYERTEGKKIDDDRLFPFSTGTARDMWNLMLRRSNLDDQDERTNVHKRHPHTLRKFFRTHMSLSIPVDVVEALMGHEAYLTEAYRRYTKDQLQELYLQGMHNVTIFDSSIDIKEEQQRLRSENKLLHEKIQDLETKFSDEVMGDLILKIMNQQKKV